MGRTIRTIQNFDGHAYGRRTTGSGFTRGGDVLETDTAQDVTTDFQYDSGGRLATETAYDANGSVVVPEATKYLYTSPIDGSLQTVEVDPDSTDGLSQNGTTRDWTITGTRPYDDDLRPGRGNAHQHRPTGGDAYLRLRQRRPRDFRRRDHTADGR